MIDDLLEQIQGGLGTVDYDRIDEYIDEKIAELKDAIVAGDITIDVDLDALVAKIKEALEDGELVFDAYDVTYNDTTVGDALDELRETLDPFWGETSGLREFTKGEVVYNVPIYLKFNKKLKSLRVFLYVNDMETANFELPPCACKFEIPKLATDTKIVFKAVAENGEECTMEVYANFHLKYYVGCSGATRITNQEVLALNSYYAYKGQNKYSHIFHPIGAQYLWWIFPVDLHTDYDFFNNGFMDSNYEWTTENVTNEYGYTSTYIFIRSGNPHTSSNIYTEVKAHEHK